MWPGKIRLQTVAAWGGCALLLWSVVPRYFGFAIHAGGLQVTSRSCSEAVFNVLFVCWSDSVPAPRFACLGRMVQEAAGGQGDQNHLLCRQQQGILNPATAASLVETTGTWPAGDVKEFGFRPLPEDGDFNSRFSATETSVAAEKEAQQDGTGTADVAASSPYSSPTNGAAPKEKSAGWFGSSEGQIRQADARRLSVWSHACSVAGQEGLWNG